VAGDWSTVRDEMSLVGEGEGEVLVRYAGLEVDAVLSSPGGVEVGVYQDGQRVTREVLGDDVRMDGAGRSHLVVREPRAYHLIRNREHGEHLLKLTVPAGPLALYGLSFSPGVIPELISG
jgi:hypothetical protein